MFSTVCIGRLGLKDVSALSGSCRCDTCANQLLIHRSFISFIPDPPSDGPKLLFYGRPQVARNMFDTGLAALRLAIARGAFNQSWSFLVKLLGWDGILFTVFPLSIKVSSTKPASRMLLTKE